MNWLGCDGEVLRLLNKKCDGQGFFFLLLQDQLVPSHIESSLSFPWRTAFGNISTLDVKPAHRPTSASEEGSSCWRSELQLQCRRLPEKNGCFSFPEASRGSVARKKKKKKKPGNMGLKLLRPCPRLVPQCNLGTKKEKVVCSASRVPSGSILPRFFVAHLFATHRRTVSSSLEFCGCVRNKE